MLYITAKETGENRYQLRLNENSAGFHRQTDGIWSQLWSIATKSDLQNMASIYTKAGRTPSSITVPTGMYVVVVSEYTYGAPIDNRYGVYLIGGGDFNDGVSHISVLPIYVSSGFSHTGFAYSITSDGSSKINFSVTTPDTIISAIKLIQN